MIKVFVMQTCPDCQRIKELAKTDKRILLIDIGEQARNLKLFLDLRDNNSAFYAARQRGNIGIPCFILENGDITFSTDEALNSTKTIITPVNENNDDAEVSNGMSCSIDGKGC